MNAPQIENLDEYYQQAESWSEERTQDITASRKIAWIVAGVAVAIALLEAIALVLLIPLKTVVPYTLLVDKQTGYVEELKPLEKRSITPDAALTRSFLVQYIIGREGYDIDSLNNSYRKIALWSAEDARARYITEMQASNPQSPIAQLPRSAVVQVKVLSVSSLSKDSSLVRFTTERTDQAGSGSPPQNFVAVIKYRFSGAAMSAEDRMTNPLGFQVIRYRRDPETAPGVAAPSAPSVPVAPPVVAPQQSGLPQPGTFVGPTP